MRAKSWILTDTVNDIWVEQLHLSNTDLRLPAADNWSITKRTLRGGRRDQIDLIDFNNGALSYAILPTRGMGLWRGDYRGHFLGWQSPVHGPVHPQYVQHIDRGGIGWLAGFDEWMCRCGLHSNGPPGEDVWQDKNGNEQRETLTLHGRIANTPAHFVEIRVSLDSPYELSVIGHVEEASLFGGRLNLISTTTTIPGSNRVTIHDVIENRGGQAAEVQLLYHCNMGPPLLEAGSRVVLPIKEMSPLTTRAAEDIHTHDQYSAPKSGYAEQVYCCEPLADEKGRTLALLYNQAADLGAAVRFDVSELACFTVWKNTAAVADGYVTGLEPATNFPNFKSFERKQGRVLSLPPGGKHECRWSIEIHDDASAVAGVLSEIVSLQARKKAVIHQTPYAQFAAAGS